MTPQEIARDIERRRACMAGAEHDGDQLGIGERGRAVRKEAFTRALGGGPFGDGGHAETDRSETG
jgi:hypothetical protein